MARPCSQGAQGRGRKSLHLLMCRRDDVLGLPNWLSDGQYFSHQITDELIGMMAHKVRRDIQSEVYTAE